MADENEGPVVPTPAAPAEGSQEGFWSDTGPGFDPESSPEAPTPEELTEDGQELGWTAESVTEFLGGVQAPAFNNLLNPLLGVSGVDWTHREARLKVVAPAIAREWNKIPQVRQLAGATDRTLILSYLLLEYLGPRGFQVVSERRELAEERAAQDAAEQATRAAAPPPSGAFSEPGPEPDDDPPRVQGLPIRRR